MPMAAPLPFPTGMKKTHEEHRPKGAKEHPKTPAKWDWISIPLSKTFQAPGLKQIRILTDQLGFGVRYIIIGPMEQAYYAPSGGLGKFDAMVSQGLLSVPHRNPGVTIYAVSATAAAAGAQ